MNANPKAAWNVTNALQDSLREGSNGLSLIPGLLVRILKENLWREFYCEPIRQTVRFDSFIEYVREGLPAGLGTDIQTLKNLCRDNRDAEAEIDKVCKRNRGKPNVDNVHNISRPTGNARDAALRRLRKDRPDLLEDVVSGQVSANAAMVKAGFRKKPTADETCLKSFAKAENRLNVLRSIIGELEVSERMIVMDWLNEVE